MQLSTHQQWQGLCNNIGVWEGTISSYDPDATLLSKQPHVLFIYVDSHDDRVKLASDLLPNVIKIRLYRCSSGSDTNMLCLNGENYVLNGGCYHPHTGSAAFGRTTLGITGNVMEFVLNAWDKEHAHVVTRCRLITIFSAEHLSKLVVFRERAGKQSVEEIKPAPAGISETESVCGGIGETVHVLQGTWDVTEDVFTIASGAATSSEEKWVEKRTVRDGKLEVEGRGCYSGAAGAGGKCATFAREGWVEERLVFLGAGASALYGLRLPRGGEWFCVGEGWMAEEGTRYTVRRVFRGYNWVEVRYGVERRTSV